MIDADQKGRLEGAGIHVDGYGSWPGLRPRVLGGAGFDVREPWRGDNESRPMLGEWGGTALTAWLPTAKAFQEPCNLDLRRRDGAFVTGRAWCVKMTPVRYGRRRLWRLEFTGIGAPSYRLE